MGVLLKTNNMKISEVIKKLKEIQDKYGNVQVRIMIDDDDTSIGLLDYAVKNHTLYLVG